MDCRRSRRVLLQGWEQFDEPADRIVSIGACEHFGHERYAGFFEMAYHTLPADGAMLLQSIVQATFKERERLGLSTTADLVHFIKFKLDELFPALAANGPDGRRARGQGRLQGDPDRVDAASLCEDPRHVGGSIRGQQRPGNRHFNRSRSTTATSST